MKYGVNNLSGNLNLYRISKDAVFSEFANDNLFSQELKNAKIQAKKIGFKNKGISKKSQSFKNNLIKQKQNNYSGKWYESGWVINNNDEELIKKIENPYFRYSNRPFYSKDNLPYTTQNNTGIYYDIVWSGYEEGDLNENFVLGGFRPNDFTQDESSMPYRNIYEVFDHKNIQIGDMGNRWFHSGEGRSSKEEIAYNKIYFQSGITKEDILKPEIKMFVLTKNTTRNNRALGSFLEVPQTQLPLPRKFYYFREKQNTIRNWIFFFSGTLDPIINHSNVSTSDQKITVGKLYQYKNTKYAEQNQNYKITFSGIYPEFTEKTFSVTNLSSGQATFYVGIPKVHSGVIEVTPPPGIGKEIEKYIWTDEDSIYPSGQKIFGYDISRNANINLNIKLKTENIKNALNSGFYSGNINLYQITGQKICKTGYVETTYSSEEENKIYKPLAKKESVPFLIYARNNNTKITADDFFYIINKNNEYIQYKENKTENIFNIGKSGLLGEYRSFGITFYSTGLNIKTGAVWDDLYKKINKIDEYSNTGAYSQLKNIYPIFSGEAYLATKSNVEWIEFSSKGNQNFKWISGYTGLFKDNRLNPKNGALETDLNIVINSDNLLPNYENKNGGNFIVSCTGTKMLFNNHLNNIFLIKGKEYRFLQKDSTNLYKFGIEDRKNNLNINIYEPEYNNVKLFNYRLLTFKVPLDYQDNHIFWSGSNNYDSGHFDVIYNITGESPLNNFAISKNNSGEYLLYTLEPENLAYETPLYKIFSEKNNLTNQLINTIDFNKYRKNLNFKFIKDLQNIDLIKDVKERTDGLWEIKEITNTGEVIKLYREDKLISLINQNYLGNVFTNPIINVAENQKYHFIRPTETSFEATGIKTIFATGYLENNIVNISGTGIFKNYSRKTHLNGSTLLSGLFGENKVKYFEYISFETTNYTTGINYIYGLENSGEFAYKGKIEIKQNDISGLQYLAALSSLESYSNTLPMPIFSGQINAKTSDINNEYNLILIFSGIENNMDYVKI